MNRACGHREHEGCGCGGRRHERHSPDAGAERCGCGRHGHRMGGGRGHHEHRRGCGCGTPAAREGAPWRRFATREEVIARLEKYLQELRAEAQAVEERLAELRAQ